MMREHDRIVLTVAMPHERLEVGDVGTVVPVYADGKAFEVEFTTLDGATAATATHDTLRLSVPLGPEMRNPHATTRSRRSVSER